MQEVMGSNILLCGFKNKLIIELLYFRKIVLATLHKQTKLNQTQAQPKRNPSATQAQHFKTTQATLN